MFDVLLRLQGPTARACAWTRAALRRRRTGLAAALVLAAAAPGCGTAFQAHQDGGEEGTAPCGAGELTDTFDDGTLDPLWKCETGATTCSEAGGKLRVEPDHTVADSRASAATQQAYHFRSCAIWVEVPSLLAAGETEFEIEDRRSSIDVEAGFAVADGQLNLALHIGTDTQDSAAPHDPAEQRWWRLREAAGQMIFDVSADGTSWSAPLWQVPTSPSLEQVNVELKAHFNGQPPGPEYAEFDNLDVSPGK